MKRTKVPGVEIIDYQFPNDNLTLMVTTKAKRQEIPKGTRIVNLVSHIDPSKGRFYAEKSNRRDVFQAYVEQWGGLHGASFEIRHVHLTCQVLTELLVFP